MAVAGCNLKKYLVLFQFSCLLELQILALNMPEVWFGVFCNSELRCWTWLKKKKVSVGSISLALLHN